MLFEMLITTCLSFLLLSGFFSCKNPAADRIVTEAYSTSAPFSEQEILSEVNAVRVRGCKCPDGKRYKPAKALTWNDRLTIAAKAHARDMADRQYFSHVSPDGVDFATRVSEAGYQWTLVAENIAYGHRTAAEVVKAWTKSNGHCQNIMNPGFREMGAAREGAYWVQELGTRP